MTDNVVASDKWGQLIFYDEWNTLELKWQPSTKDASDGDIQKTMELLRAETENRKPSALILDATEFHQQWGEAMQEWSNENIIPGFNRAGVGKLAFIAGPGFPGPTVEKGAQPAPQAPANFPTGYFSTRERAYGWLAGS
jgi:hypothetical protein